MLFIASPRWGTDPIERPSAVRANGSHDRQMRATYTDLRDGERFGITVEFISRRPLGGRHRHVGRLLVEDTTGEQFVVLSTPGEGRLFGLESGEQYRLSGLLGVTPGASSSTEECPGCGARLGPSAAADAIREATEALGLDRSFGVVDDRTSVGRAAGENRLVDDWRPVADETDGAGSLCPGCAQQVDIPGLAAVSGPTRDSGLASEPQGDRSGDAGEPVATSVGVNVANGYTPQPAAVDNTTLYGESQFGTRRDGGAGPRLAPHYGTTVTEHPVTGETEQYLTVELDTTSPDGGFERPRLDLVAVLDVSDSMSGPVDGYYYDGRDESDGAAATKLSVAARSLCALVGQLRENDRLGVVLCDDDTHVAKPLRKIASTDTTAIQRHVRTVAAGGDTDLAAGFETAAGMLDTASDADGEQRVVLFTDMMANAGLTDSAELTALFADSATEGIHTTLVGVGADTNVQLATTLSDVRGANQLVTCSAASFERLSGEAFDRLVTPVVHDLTLELDDDHHEFVAAYGSPSADTPTDQLVYVGTLFPPWNPVTGEGPLLVEVDRTTTTDELTLVASWTECGGDEHTETVRVGWPAGSERYPHDGVRRSVALARCTRELRAWAANRYEQVETGRTGDESLPDRRGEHCRGSVPLVVPDRYRERFDRLSGYLDAEADRLDDETLRQMRVLLDRLCRRQESGSE